VANEAPCCEGCAARLTRAPPSRWPFALVFGGVGLATCLAAAHVLGNDAAITFGFAALVCVVLALVIGTSGREERSDPAAVWERNEETRVDDPLGRGQPYRRFAARAAAKAAPLSGRSTAIVLSVSLAVTAVLFPTVLRLPHWIEAEVVLGAWWTLLAALSTTLLYRGFRLRDDYRYQAPTWSSPIDKDASGCAHASGCGEGLIVVVVVLVALAAAWLVVELVIPALFFAVYYLLTRSIGAAAVSNRDCEGKLLRSLGWGAWIATRSVVPLALVVVVVHAFLSR
jgi:hypothetical protein